MVYAIKRASESYAAMRVHELFSMCVCVFRLLGRRSELIVKREITTRDRRTRFWLLSSDRPSFLCLRAITAKSLRK